VFTVTQIVYWTVAATLLAAECEEILSFAAESAIESWAWQSTRRTTWTGLTD